MDKYFRVHIHVQHLNLYTCNADIKALFLSLPLSSLSLSLSLLRSRKDSPQFFSRSCDWVLSIVRNYRSAFKKLVPVSSHDVPGDSIFINTMTCNLREGEREGMIERIQLM